MEKALFHPRSRKPPWLVWGLWALAIAGLLYLVGLTVWLGITGLFFPYQLDYGEGTHLHYAKELLAGQPIYRPIGEWPYITSNYAPLPFILAIALFPVLGATYAAGRIWTLLAIVAISAITIAWVRRESKQWLPAVVAALLFAGSPYIYHWAPLFRVDLVGLALTLGGLYVIYRAFPRSKGEQKPWLAWVAALLFVAALFAKQSFLFAPAAAIAYLFLFVDRWRAIQVAAAIGLLGGGLFLVINLATGGSFWEAMVVANVNPFLWPEFWKQQADFFGTFAILALLTAFYVVDKFILNRETPIREKTNLLDLYLPAALVGILLAGKAGAWENYFFEALAAFALCAGLGLARLAPLPRGRRPTHGRWGRGKSVRHLLAPLLVLAQVALMWHTPRIASRYVELTRQSYEQIAPILENTPDPIFAEDMGLLVAYDKVLDYHSFEYSQLARVGRWDQAWELGELRNRNRSLVILDQGTRLDVDRYQRYTREFLSELDRNYRHARTVGKFELYEPDPLQHEGHIEFGDQLALVGWSLHTSPELQPGDTFGLIVVWQAKQSLTADYTAFAHLVDENGQGWAGDDHPPYEGLYPTSGWGPGEMVRDTFEMTIPPDALPGLYGVQVGWYPSAPLRAGAPGTQERLSFGNGDSFRVAIVPVGWESDTTEGLTPLEARFAEEVRLEGYAWQVDSGAVQVRLRWSADDYLDTDYTVFVHLVVADDQTQVVAQGDAPPLSGQWPTSLWLPNVALDDAHTVEIPVDLPPGAYHLLVGLYNPTTFERLHLPDGADAVDLGVIQLP